MLIFQQYRRQGRRMFAAAATLRKMYVKVPFTTPTHIFFMRNLIAIMFYAKGGKWNEADGLAAAAGKTSPLAY